MWIKCSATRQNNTLLMVMWPDALAVTLQVTSSPWVKFLQLRFLTHYGTEPVCAINDIIVHGRGANEDLEELLSTDSEAEVPLVIPLPSVVLPLAEQSVKAAANDAAAAAEVGGGLAAAVVGLADVRTASNGSSAGGQPGAQDGAPIDSAAGPVLRADAAAAAKAVDDTLPAAATPDSAALRSEPTLASPQPDGSNGSSIAAVSEPSGHVNSDMARDQPNGGPASKATTQPSPAPAAAAAHKSAAAVPESPNGPLPAPTSAMPAVAATPTPPLPVESMLADSPATPPRPVAVAAPSAALARAPARAELDFAELAVGSGRSGGRIYDVLVQAREASMLPSSAPKLNDRNHTAIELHMLSESSCCPQLECSAS